jgi:hypothetical protein
MNRVSGTSPRRCGQPGYSRGTINASAVIAGYPQPSRPTLLIAENRRKPLPGAVIPRLAAGLSARVLGYPRTPPKGERALRTTHLPRNQGRCTACVTL